MITNLIGFNIALTNVDAKWKQHCIDVVPTLYRDTSPQRLNAVLMPDPVYITDRSKLY